MVKLPSRMDPLPVSQASLSAAIETRRRVSSTSTTADFLGELWLGSEEMPKNGHSNMQQLDVQQSWDVNLDSPAEPCQAITVLLELENSCVASRTNLLLFIIMRWLVGSDQ